MNFSKKDSSSLVDSLCDFPKTFDEASKCKCLQIPFLKPKLEFGSTKSEDNCFAHYHNYILEQPIGKSILPFQFGNTSSCVFLTKKLEIHGNQFNLTEFVNLNYCQIHHF